MQIIEEGNFIKVFYKDHIYQKLRKDSTIYVLGNHDWRILKEYNGQTTKIGLFPEFSEKIEEEYQNELKRIDREKKLNRIISKEI